MSDAELWQVRLPNGEVHPATLDQIEQAFQGGHIDAKTMVLEAGSTEWKTLGELAGLDDAPPAPSPSPVAHAPVQQVPQMPPVQQAPQYVQPVQSAPPMQYAQPVQSVPPMQYAQPVQSAPPLQYAQPVRSVPPMQYAQPVQSVPPMQQPVHAVQSRYAPIPSSTSAVSTGFDDSDLAPVAFRGGSRKRWVVALAGIAAAAGIAGVAITRAHGSSSDDTETTAAATRPPAPAYIPPPEAPVAAAPVTNPGPSTGDSPLTPHFTDQKRQPPPERETKGHPSGPARHGGSRSKSTGFTSDGNKFDPLNAGI